MKEEDPRIQVGIDMGLGNNWKDWNVTVLENAKYDFVEVHYYPECKCLGNQGDDTALLTTESDQFAENVAAARSLLAANGHANTPLYLGEFDRDGEEQSLGHQTKSIVDGLFNAVIVAEGIKADIKMITAWNGINGCKPDAASSYGYGWQNFSSPGLFANGGNAANWSCPLFGVPKGTPFPKARAYQILSKYVLAGENVIGISSTNPSVRAYAATNRGGYALLLLNNDRATTQTTSVRTKNATAPNPP